MNTTENINGTIISISDVIAVTLCNNHEIPQSLCNECFLTPDITLHRLPGFRNLSEHVLYEFIDSGYVFLSPDHTFTQMLKNGHRPPFISSVNRILFNEDGLFALESDQIIVYFNSAPSTDQLADFIINNGLTVVADLRTDKSRMLFRINGGESVWKLSSQIEKHPLVRFAEPDLLRCIFQNSLPIVSHGPYAPHLWHLNNDGGANTMAFVPRLKYADIAAAAAWSIAVNAGSSVKIAAIERGFDIYHPDLSAGIKTQGSGTNQTSAGAINFNDKNDSTSVSTAITVHYTGNGFFSHGTATISFFGARKNVSGTTGVAYNCEIIPIQIASLNRDNLLSAAIEYAADPTTIIPTADLNDAADIVNMSFGADFDFTAGKALTEAITFGVLFGRKGRGMCILKSPSNDNISVTKDAILKNKYLFLVCRMAPNGKYGGSAYGNSVDFMAPGEDLFHANVSSSPPGSPSIARLVSAINPPVTDNGYVTATSGTSWAGPIMAGVIGLMLDVNPLLTWVEVHKILRETAFPRSADNRNTLQKWKDIQDNEIVDNNGLLYFTTGNTTLSGNITLPSTDDVRRVTFNVNDASGFSKRQLILIGNQANLVSITNATTIVVDDVTGFAQGQKISIGSSNSSITFKTYKISFIEKWFDTNLAPFETPQNQIKVPENSGFLPGQDVQLDGIDETNTRNVVSEILTIASVDPDGETITFTTNRVNDYSQYGSIKVIHLQENLLISSVDTLTNTITLNASTPILTANLTKFPAGTRVQITGSELVVVKDFDTINNTLTTTLPQNNIVLFTTPGADIQVRGGRTPYRAFKYAFGSIDAGEAVREAKRIYDNATATTPVLEWDLVIRDTAGDTGSVPSTAGLIDSPDIWINHDDTIPTVPYSTTSGLHEQPIANKERYIFVRVKNNGVSPCLDAEIRVYLRTTLPSSTPNFNFPEGWKNPQDIRNVKNAAAPGFYYFDRGMIEIKENEIAAGGDKIYRIKWPKRFVPSRSVNLDSYIQVMITPFDGPYGSAPLAVTHQVADINNISYKQISIFDQVLFKDVPGGSFIDNTNEISAYASVQTYPFAIEINNPVAFATTDTEIQIRRKSKGIGNSETVTFKYISGSWQFDGPAPSWVTFSMTPAPGTGTSTTFTGTYKLSPEEKFIQFNVQVSGSGYGFPIDETFRIKNKITDFDEASETSAGGPKMHFFTTTDSSVLALQLSANAFGSFNDPLQPAKNFFRVTSRHTATGTAKAYAVCNGIVCVQKTDSTHVNIILKPTQQPGFNAAGIRYFIYKGIKLSSLFNGTDIATKTTNRLTETIWISAENRFNSISAKNIDLGLPAPPITDFTPPSEQELGIHLITGFNGVLFDDSASVDNLFFIGDPNYQLPVVFGGWDIGEFDNTGFGFEVIMDNPAIPFTLKRVREANTILEADVITGSEPADQQLLNRLSREELLNYMDPCAFFGSLYGNKLYTITGNASLVFTGDFTPKKKNDIYNNVLVTAFANPGKTYVDIRNEFGYSYNFLQNYRDTILLDVGSNVTSEGSSTPENYYADGWPLLVLNSDFFPIDESGSKLEFNIRLPLAGPDINIDPKGDNLYPLIYIAQGYTTDQFLRNKRGPARFFVPEASRDSLDQLDLLYMINQLILAVPNNTSLAVNAPVSSYVRLKYLKRFAPLSLTPPLPSSGIVLRSQDYMDNLFLPVSMQIPFSGSGTIRSVVYESETYIDAYNIPEIGISCIAKTGVAEDSDNVTYFAFTQEIHSKQSEVTNQFSIAGESTSASNHFFEHLTKKYKQVQFASEQLDIGTDSFDIIFLTNTETGTDTTFDQVDPNEFFSISVTKAQHTALLATASGAGFEPLLPVYLAVTGKTQATDDDGIAYTSFDLVLRGYTHSGAAYQVTEVPVTPVIKIYLLGNK